MMTFKQWLKHREQSEQQPTQPVPSQLIQMHGLCPQSNPEIYQRSNRAFGINTGSNMVRLIRRALYKLPCDDGGVEFSNSQCVQSKS